MKIWKNIIIFISLFISITIIVSTKWFLTTFDNLDLEEIIFQLLVPLKGTNINYFYTYFINAMVPIIIITLIIFYLLIKKYDYKIDISLKIKKLNKIIKLNLLNYRFIYLIAIFAFSIVYCTNSLGLKAFVKNQFTTSDFIKENYVDPEDIKLTFPKRKRNLIYIYMESMESSYTSNEEGGLERYNLIPNLTKIANDNINFSSNDKVGGFYLTPGGTWTVGAMVSQSFGVPLKLSFNERGYNRFNSFLPGATNLGDILAKNGYNQVIMFGSDAQFGGRDKLFHSHGNYDIYDVNTAIKKGKMADKDRVWWGFEDKNLYIYAKEQLVELSAKKEPFNFTMLTVDTHAEDGYLSVSCDKKYESNYANVINCADKQIDSFLKWIKNQDFYKNTTIIITGDHLSMSPYYIGNEYDFNKRKVYNTIINSKVNSDNTKNRSYLAYDLFPTTIRSLGITIPGDKLGLGVNLFSDEQTLIEKYGYNHVSKELSKKSDFYDKNFVYVKKK